MSTPRRKSAAVPNGQYVALLRAINVGGHTVKMDRLRELFEQLGFANVATFIASGNVIFDAAEHDEAALSERIEAHLRAALGYDVATFIRSRAALAAVAAHQPFTEQAAAEEAVYVMFLGRRPEPVAATKVVALSNEVDVLHVHDREVYWLARKRFGESTISGALLERTLGQPGTLRNTTTVAKLVAKYPASGI